MEVDLNLKGVVHLLLSEEVLANYYKELTMLSESKICPIDSIFWDKLKMRGYAPLEKFEKKEFPLFIDLDCEPIIHNPRKYQLLKKSKKRIKN